MKKKVRIHSVESFVKRYEKVCKDEVVPSTETLYNYINQGLLEVERMDLPRATRMRPRTKKRPTTHKRLAGKSITERPEFIQTRSEFGHWEIDLMIGKKFINEAVLLTLVKERLDLRLLENYHLSLQILLLMKSIKSLHNIKN